MKGIKYFIIITQREFTEKYLDAFSQVGIKVTTKELVNGTASKSALNLLGLEKTEMIMFKGMTTDESRQKLNELLIDDLKIYNAGNGIAIYLPVDGLGGTSTKNALLGEVPLQNKEKEMSENLSKNVLIITIVDKGNTELVMDSAKEKGATGGTVSKAQGTGVEMAKFFGMTISQEKEMVYIVAKREQRDDIMYAIMEKTGAKTEAHGICFSLPIDSVVGIRSLEN